MYVQRQFSAQVVAGTDPEPVANTNYLWQLTDKSPRYVLSIGKGKYCQDTINLAASGSFTVPLPNQYDPLSRLSVFIRSNGNIKAVTVSPFDPTSTILIRAGALTGQDGLLTSCGRVTSITLTNPSTTTAATVEYFLFELPDLALASSYRDQQIATGVQTR